MVKMSMFRLRDNAGDIVKGGVLALVAGVVVVGLVIAVGVMAIFGVGWLSRSTADFRGKTNETNQVNSGNYRIAAYNHFYDLCAAVQTDETRIANAEADLKANKDPDRAPELQANLDAAKNTRAADINQYNADAHKADTLAHFRASDLPYQIDPTEEKTSCTA